MSAWHKEARKLYAAGKTQAAIAHIFGKSESTVRAALDLNGERERANERRRKRRLLNGRRENNREDAVQEPITQRAAVSLAPVSALATGGDETLPIRSFAPKTRVSVNPGAERWRSIHQAMLRAGKIAQPDVLSEWRQ